MLEKHISYDSLNSCDFKSLLSLYEPLIFSLVKIFSPSQSTTDDMVQEASIALYHAALSYKSNEKVTFGLYAKICIKNRLISYLRHYNSQNGDILTCDDSNCVFSPEEMDPLDIIISKERLDTLKLLVKKNLTLYENEVFDFYCEGFGCHEIALRLSKTDKSVGNAIYRIKSKLKKLV